MITLKELYLKVIKELKEDFLSETMTPDVQNIISAYKRQNLKITRHAIERVLQRGSEQSRNVYSYIEPEDKIKSIQFLKNFLFFSPRLYPVEDSSHAKQGEYAFQFWDGTRTKYVGVVFTSSNFNHGEVKITTYVDKLADKQSDQGEGPKSSEPKKGPVVIYKNKYTPEPEQSPTVSSAPASKPKPPPPKPKRMGNTLSGYSKKGYRW